MTLNGLSNIQRAVVSGGVLQGSGSASIADLSWTGGTIQGGALDPEWQVNNLHLAGLTTLQGRTLNLGAEGNSVADGATLLMSSGANLNNAGVLTLSNGSFLGYPVANGGNSTINNSGTIISVADVADPRVNAIGGVQEIGVSTTRFNNLAGATVRVQDSTLELGPGTHNGSLQLSATGAGAPDSKLTFYHYGGVVDLNAGTTISETRANGGVTSVQFGNPKSTQPGEAAGMTRINTDLTLDNVILGSGTLAGSGSLTATNLAWQGGIISGQSEAPAFTVTNLSTAGALALEGRTLNLLAGGSGTAAALSTLDINGSGVLNSAGAVTLGTLVNAGTVNVTGGQLGTAGVQNAGRIRLAEGASLLASGGVLNLESGSLAGSGTVNTGQYYLVNSGRISAGSAETIGTLTVQGNLQQTATGITKIKSGSAGQFDRLAVSGNVLLDGKLIVSQLDANLPAVGESQVFLTMGGARSGSFAVTVLPSTATRYFNNAGGDFSWANQANWSGSVLPGAADDVWIHAGNTISHTAGSDVIDKLALIGATPLSITGGSLTVGGATTIDGMLNVSGSGTYTSNGSVGGAGTLQVAGGSAVLNGTTSLPTLAISSGSVSGSGSLAVTRSFSQTGGAFNMPGTVTLTQQSGDLSIANMIAGDLNLVASAGAIRQTAGLTATSLQTSSVGGTLLTNSGNRIRNFKGVNAGTGNIALVNVSSPSSLVLNGISNSAPGGSISVDNTGGIIDNAPIIAANGTVSLVARSPLVVNAPISAGSNVILQAMSSTGGNDNLTINSSVTSTTGSLQLSAGTALSVSSTGSLSVTGGTIALTSVSGTVTVADPTRIVGATPTVTAPPPVIAPVAPVTPVTPVTNATTETTLLAATTSIVSSTNKSSTQSSTTTKDAGLGTVAPIVSTTTGSTNTFTLAGDQTVGGTTGTFGGSNVASLGETGASTTFAGPVGSASTPGSDNTSSNSSTSSSSSSSSTSVASASTSSSSSSPDSSTSSSASASGDKKDDKKDEKSGKDDKSDKSEKKSQTATKSAKKSLPVCS